MDERELGTYRLTELPDRDVYVSTIYRKSSAMLDGEFRYFETMAFPYPGPRPRILWQSAAITEREADRQHDLAARYFSRPWR